MADVRAAWNDAGEKLSGLGQKLKLHYDQQHGQDSQATREEVADAAKRLGAAVQDAFEAIGAAAKDKAVQADVKQVGQSLLDALGATFGQVSGDLRRTLSERKGASTTFEGSPEASSGPAPTTEAEAVTEPAAEPGVGEAAGPGPDGDGSQPPKVEPWGTP
jgi:hypothetical protein